jgi:cell division septum initiation protein DivIVA
VAYSGAPLPSNDFPTNRRGYDREAVDGFVRSAQTRLDELETQVQRLIAENGQLRHDLSGAEERAHPDFNNLGGRAQEILRVAEEQAGDITAQAQRDADRMLEQTDSETQQHRERTENELAAIRDRTLGELDALRRQAEGDAGAIYGHARTESEQLLASARVEAQALLVENERLTAARLETARVEAQQLVAAAEREAASIRDQTAVERDRALTDLRAVQDDAQARIEAMLNESSQLQTQAANHLTEQTEVAARLRHDALSEADRVKRASLEEADGIVARAQAQAGTIDERARQEFAWRRRQMRREQDLLDRRKQAMLSQLTSLSALAAETAQSLPEVPALELSDLEETRVNQPVSLEAGTAEEPTDLASVSSR